MRVGLIDVDSHNFPNLALMKISAHHKARGDDDGGRRSPDGGVWGVGMDVCDGED